MATLLLGTGLTLLTTTAAWAASPVYDKIAFSRQQSGLDWDIWIMNVDGSNQIRLLDNAHRDADPHFRYDGTKIVFGRSIQGNPPTLDIYVINPDGTGQTCLTCDLPTDAGQPKFSWDGTKIVFAVAAGPVGTFNDDIYTMNADGSGRAGLLTAGTDDVWPSYSPDGQHIVFQRYVTSRADPNPKSKICRYSIGDGITTDLTDGSDLDEMPVYSPDGRYVVFKRGFTNTEIYRLDLVASTLENLTNSDAAGEDAPVYSYEGDKIAFFSLTTDISTAEIWIMNSDGTNKKPLTSNSVADFNPTFSPASGAATYAARITGIAVVPDPSGVGQGSKMIFTVSVQNTGAKDISTARVQVKIYKPDGTLAASPYKSVSSFVAGTERTVQITYTLSSSAPLGVWTYGVYVYRVTYTSTTLLDQVTGQSFTVQPVVMTGEIVSVADAPDPVTRGSTVTFTVTVENTGNVIWSSGKVTVKIYKPGGSLYTTKSLSISNILPGVEYTYNVKWTVSSYAPKGTYRYDVYFYRVSGYTSILMDSDVGSPSNTIQVN